MEVRLEKLPLFEKLFELGIKPISDNFEETLVSLIKEKIAAKVDLNYVSPDTFAKVDQIAKNFKTITKKDWRSTAVSLELLTFSLIFKRSYNLSL